MSEREFPGCGVARYGKATHSVNSHNNIRQRKHNSTNLNAIYNSYAAQNPLIAAKIVGCKEENMSRLASNFRIYVQFPAVYERQITNE